MKLWILAFVVLLIACGSSVSQQSISDAGSVAPTSVETVAEDSSATNDSPDSSEKTVPESTDKPKTNFIPTHTIDIRFLFFEPNVTTVKTGTKVVWVHRDDIKPFHRVLSLDSVETENRQIRPLFDSGRMGFEETYSYVFDKPGIYQYLDPFFTKDDDLMGGFITVED
ncbi:MAG: hypothetical protein QGH47_06465 [Candidatus Woesearchaeota archaeon]|nr:hypothetical protein [Candidatus Woesearchaeota archaeon]